MKKRERRAKNASRRRKLFDAAITRQALKDSFVKLNLPGGGLTVLIDLPIADDGHGAGGSG